MKTLALSIVLALTSASAFAQRPQFLEFKNPRLGSYVLNMDSTFKGVCKILTGKKNTYVSRSAVAGKRVKDTVEVNRKGEVISHFKDKKKRAIAQVSCYVN